MRIFLTGASGFAGSYILRDLLNEGGHEVAILLRKPETAWRIKDLLADIRVIEGDLNNLSAIEKHLKNFQPLALVHAAWHGVAGKDRNSLMQWRNVAPSLELVEMASRAGVKHWIGLGSQAEYGPCQNKINEAAATKPTTLYGAAKLSAGLLSQLLCQELGIRHVWLRLFSSYGPADNSDWLIPYLIRTLLSKQKPRLTAAEQRWDYIYIEDVATAVRAVLESDEAAGIFNLGSGVALSLRAVIEKIRDFIDTDLSLGFGEESYRPDQVMHLEADIARLTGLTGWYPKVEIDIGLKKTVDWYLSEAHGI